MFYFEPASCNILVNLFQAALEHALLPRSARDVFGKPCGLRLGDGSFLVAVVCLLEVSDARQSGTEIIQ